jgi:hypothetical protein
MACELPVVGTVPRFVEVVSSVKLLLLQERQDQNSPTMHRLAILVGDIRRWEATICLVIVGDRQRDLLEVSGGACRAGSVSCVLHGLIEIGPKGTNNHDHDRES